MAVVIGLSGSLRERSFNRALLGAAVELAPAGLTVEVGDIRGIPLYNADVEARDGIPDAVEVLQERIAEAQGLLLVTPEYNNAMPGVFKNAIDWLTRPPKAIGRVFGGKPVGIIGATPGRGGTRLSQTAWLPVLRALGMRPFFGRSLYVDGVGDLFDSDLALVDEGTRKRLSRYLADFHEFLTG